MNKWLLIGCLLYELVIYNIFFNMPQNKEGLLFFETTIESMKCEPGGKVIKFWNINESSSENDISFSFFYGNDCKKINEKAYVGKKIQIYKRTRTSTPVEVVLGERVIYSVEDTYSSAVESGYMAASVGFFIYFGYTIPRIRRKRNNQ